MAEEVRQAIWRAVAMIAAFSFFMHMLVLVVPLFSLQIYDRVLSSRSGETLLWLSALAVFLIVIFAVLDALRARILVRVSGWLEQRLAPALLAGNLAGDLGRYGVLGTQGLDDLGALRRFLTGPGAVNLFDAPWMPLYLAIIWLLHPWLGVVATVSAACLFLTGFANEIATRRGLAEANEIGADTMAALRTTLLGVETVRALGMRQAVLRQWQTGNDSVLRLQARASDRAGMIQAFARFERLAAQVAIVGVGAWLAVGHAITPGALIAAAIIVSRALAPAENLIGSWRSVTAAREAYRRILERLRAATPDRGLRLPPPHGRLDVEGVSLSLPGMDRPVLDSIRFTLHAGESLGIIGPSGAGKSSLARLILGVVAPELGCGAARRRRHHRMGS